jgi:O-antigen/teichoic acid export membrane protein
LFPVLRNTLGSYHRFYWLTVALVVSSLWYENIGTLLQADLRSIQYAWFRIGNAVLRLILALGWLYLIAMDVIGIMWGILLAQLVFVILMMYNFRQEFGKAQRVSNAYIFSLQTFCKFTKQFATFGLPMIGWMLGTKLLNISDRYLLQFFRGSAEVGIYSPIYDLVSYNLGLLSAPLLMVAHPLLMKVANAKTADHSQLQELITAFSRYFLLVSLFILVFIAIFAQELASVFLGPAYQQGAVIIPILLVGFLAWNFSMYGHKGLEIRERTKALFIYVLICAMTNIVLNLYFIPSYGYIGAAITTSISFILYPVLVYFGTRSDIAWKIPWSSMGRIGLASLLTAGVLIIIKYFLSMHSTLVLLLITASIGMLIYVVIIYILREMQPDEVRIIWQLVGRLWKRLNSL